MLFSLHVKATMMKIADPIVFGHVVSVFFEDVVTKHAATLKKLGVNLNNGFGDLLAKIETLPDAEKKVIKDDITACYAKRPALAMVNSDKGITGLHVPSDFIIDASIPAMIRESGRMWGPDGKAYDTKAVVPDRAYAGLFQVAIDDCKAHGAFDPKTMGSVPNVGLMAQKAQEYGSHDKTFEVAATGKVRVVADDGTVMLERAGRSWRHLPHVPAARYPGAGLGHAGRPPRAHHQHASRVLARQEPRPRRAADRQGRDVSEEARHQRASTSASSRPSTR